MKAELRGWQPTPEELEHQRLVFRRDYGRDPKPEEVGMWKALVRCGAIQLPNHLLNSLQSKT